MIIFFLEQPDICSGADRNRISGRIKPREAILSFVSDAGNPEERQIASHMVTGLPITATGMEMGKK